MRWKVWVVTPRGDAHWQGLAMAAEGVAVALAELGLGGDSVHSHEVPKADRLVIFNAHRLDDQKIPDDAIIYNAEQVQDSPEWRAHPYSSLLRSHTVWDYSRVNIERMKALGVERAVHCPIGYWPGLVTAASMVVDQQVDVLFFGSLSDRRKQILLAIAGAGLTVKALHGVYGPNREAWIARSKIVLNLHYYQNPIFEIFRVSHLFANRKCVVTEDGGCDPELEAIARRGAVYVPTAKIVNACTTLVRTQSLRTEASERGHYAIRGICQEAAVKAALELS